jgi:hypothetical protein
MEMIKVLNSEEEKQQLQQQQEQNQQQQLQQLHEQQEEQREAGEGSKDGSGVRSADATGGQCAFSAILTTRRGVSCSTPLNQTIGGPRAGQRPFTVPIVYREANGNQRNGSLASVGVLTLCKQGHHHGKLHPRVPIIWVD